MGGTKRKRTYRSIPRRALLLSLVLLLASTPPAAAQLPDAGEDVYFDNCVYCHGEEGKGMGLWSQPDFTSKGLWLETPREELLDQVRNGGEVMPGFEGNLTEEETRDVLAYGASLAGVEFQDLGRGMDSLEGEGGEEEPSDHSTDGSRESSETREAPGEEPKDAPATGAALAAAAATETALLRTKH